MFTNASRRGLFRFARVVVVSRAGEDERVVSDEDDVVEYVLRICEPYVRLTAGFAEDMVEAVEEE